MKSEYNYLNKEIPYHERDFLLVKRLIHERAGIWLADNKQEMVYGRLSRVIRKEKLENISSYLKKLQESNDEAMWQDFVNALTTNLTAFFRESHHFDTLREFLMSRKHKPVRLWCAASSTGEEPYSMAMVAREVMGPQADCKILASDIDTEALHTAKKGVYAKDTLKGLPDRYIRSNFQKGQGGNMGMVRAKEELKRMIDFKRINLTDPPPLSVKYDAIFCRNVMIYFNTETQRKILKYFAKALKPDGLLFIGHSESLSLISDEFHLIGKTVYKLGDAK